MIPHDSYTINGTTFLNKNDLIEYNHKRFLTDLGFPFGYITFAVTGGDEAWVCDKRTGKVAWITTDSFNDDYVLDVLSEDGEELEINQENFSKGFFDHATFPSFEEFMDKAVFSDKWIDEAEAEVEAEKE